MVPPVIPNGLDPAKGGATIPLSPKKENAMYIDSIHCDVNICVLSQDGSFWMQTLLIWV